MGGFRERPLLSQNHRIEGLETEAVSPRFLSLALVISFLLAVGGCCQACPEGGGGNKNGRKPLPLSISSVSSEFALRIVFLVFAVIREILLSSEVIHFSV